MTAMRWARCICVAYDVAVANERAVGSSSGLGFSQTTGVRNAGLSGVARGGWGIIRAWERGWVGEASRPFSTKPQGQPGNIRRTEK